VKIEAIPKKLPFQEAIDYFRKKYVNAANVDTYTHLKGDIHDRAFMVAGGVPMDVLVDIRKLVDKAIAEGTPLKEFREGFEKTIENRWVPKQNTGWRAKKILDTNTDVAYSAGRYHQMKKMEDTHPFWQYKHSGAVKYRPEHKDLDGMVIRADDPWWDTYYPPNGWGCGCKVVALTEGQVARRGLAVTTDPPTPEIDPHWAYAPGRQQLVWPARDPGGERPSDAEKDPGKWVEMDKNPKTWSDYGLKEKLEPKDPVGPDPLNPIGEFSPEGIKDPVGAVKKVLGGDQQLFHIDIDGHKIPLLVDAKRFAGHLENLEKDNRGRYLGFLKNVLEPQEVWLKFVQREGGAYAGRVEARWTLVSAVKTGANESFVLVTDVNSQGIMEAYTFYTPDRAKDIKKLRRGVLMKGNK